MKDLNLKNKVALVTGASRGIGAAIAKELAARGAKVVITYAGNKKAADETVEAITKLDGQAFALRADAADGKAVETAVEETVRRFGGLDILVNNAGIAPSGPVEELPLEEFDRLFQVNVRGVYVASRSALKHLKEGGRIIQIGSVVAERVPFGGTAAYAATKAAVAGLTRALARELGPRGITVNNVQPGPIDTDMNPADGPFAPLAKPYLALGRYGTTDEIAKAVAFLAGPDSSYITGASLSVDGGFLA